jgi:hypothetical protein
MRWQLPAGVLALLLLLLVFLPLWRGLSAELHDPGLPPPPANGNPPPPTPPPIQIPTTTEVTSLPPTVRKGDDFEVVGEVRDARNGQPVANATVAVFLNLTKEEPGVRVGLTTTDAEGVFRVQPNLTGMDARDYQVVAYALPTPIGPGIGYKDSWSDPPLHVTASTHLELIAPAREAVGAPVLVGGHLLESTGEPVGGATVELDVAGAGSYQLTTDAAGLWSTNLTFAATGEYALHARYAGTENIEPAENATRVSIATVVLLLPEHLETARGEPFTVAGAVHIGATGDAGRDVRLLYRLPLVTEGGEVHELAAEAETDATGIFRSTVLVSRTAALVAGTLQVTLDDGVTTAQAEVAVRARPVVTLQVPREVDTTLPASVHLQDDLGLAMGGAAVKLQVWDGERLLQERVLKTDARGDASATLDLGSSLSYARVQAVYEGGGDYFPAGDAVPVKVNGMVNALLALAGGVAALSGTAWWIFRPRPAPPGPALTLDFPERAAPLPPVWAPGEPVRVRVKLLGPDGAPMAGARVQVHVGDEADELRTDLRGEAALERVFADAGEVALVAEARPKDGRVTWATAVARVADYRREVGREFRDFRFHAARLGIAASADRAPRELEKVLAGLPLPPEHVEALLGGFERANYSERAFHRDDYLAFMAAKRALLHELRAPPFTPRDDPWAAVRARLLALRQLLADFPTKLGGGAPGR